MFSRIASAALLALPAATATALDLRLESRLEAVAGPGWRAEGIVFTLAHTATGTGQLQAEIKRLELPGLPPLMQLALRCAEFSLTDADIRCSGGELKLAGQIAAVAFTLTRGADSAITAAKITLNSRRLTLASADGRYAADKLNARLNVRWTVAQSAFTAELALNGGQLYLDPLFWDVAAAPLTLSATGKQDGARWVIDQATLQQPGVLTAQGALTVAAGLQSLDMTVENAEFPAAYTQYLQPWLGASVLAGVQTTGRLSGRLAYSKGRLQALAVNLDKVSLEDPAGQFGLSGIHARIAWDTGKTPRPATLRWQAGHLYALTLSPAELSAETRAASVALTRPARIPLLDGALLLEEFSGHWQPQLAWQLRARLLPLSMQQLSAVFGWPALAGQLAGEIPRMRYANGDLAVDGSLRVRVFDGDIGVDHLLIDDLFGPTPALGADLTVRNLDLLTLTRTFDFGRIEGKLGGRVTGLRLLNWQPVAFDAVLETPPNDDSRRRISQQAVQAISSLGGAGAAVGSGFLSLFEEFNYRRLGVRCRLEGEVCIMDGVAPAPDGAYYLVQGSGLPRIDVIGYNRRVDWPELLARLKAAMQSEGPEIR